MKTYNYGVASWKLALAPIPIVDDVEGFGTDDNDDGGGLLLFTVATDGLGLELMGQARGVAVTKMGDAFQEQTLKEVMTKFVD